MHFVATSASVGLFRLILCGYVNSLANSVQPTRRWENWARSELQQQQQQKQLLSVSDFLCTLAVLISIILLVSPGSSVGSMVSMGGVQGSRDALLKSSVNKYANALGDVQQMRLALHSFAFASYSQHIPHTHTHPHTYTHTGNSKHAYAVSARLIAISLDSVFVLWL